MKDQPGGKEVFFRQDVTAEYIRTATAFPTADEVFRQFLVKLGPLISRIAVRRFSDSFAISFQPGSKVNLVNLSDGKYDQTGVHSLICEFLIMVDNLSGQNARMMFYRAGRPGADQIMSFSFKSWRRKDSGIKKITLDSEVLNMDFVPDFGEGEFLVLDMEGSGRQDLARILRSIADDVVYDQQDESLRPPGATGRYLREDMDNFSELTRVCYQGPEGLMRFFSERFGPIVESVEIQNFGSGHYPYALKMTFKEAFKSRLDPRKIWHGIQETVPQSESADLVRLAILMSRILDDKRTDVSISSIENGHREYVYFNYYPAMLGQQAALETNYQSSDEPFEQDEITMMALLPCRNEQELALIQWLIEKVFRG